MNKQFLMGIVMIASLIALGTAGLKLLDKVDQEVKENPEELKEDLKKSQVWMLPLVIGLIGVGIIPLFRTYKVWYKELKTVCPQCNHKHSGEFGSCEFHAKGCSCNLSINISGRVRLIRYLPLGVIPMILFAIIYTVVINVWK